MELVVCDGVVYESPLVHSEDIILSSVEVFKNAGVLFIVDTN